MMLISSSAKSAKLETLTLWGSTATLDMHDFLEMQEKKKIFQSQKFGLVEYHSLSQTEKSFLLASCFGKYSVLHLFSCLLYQLTNSGQLFLFPQILVGFLLQSVWLMKKVYYLLMRNIGHFKFGIWDLCQNCFIISFQSTFI